MRPLGGDAYAGKQKAGSLMAAQTWPCPHRAKTLLSVNLIFDYCRSSASSRSASHTGNCAMTKQSIDQNYTDLVSTATRGSIPARRMRVMRFKACQMYSAYANNRSAQKYGSEHEAVEPVLHSGLTRSGLCSAPGVHRHPPFPGRSVARC